MNEVREATTLDLFERWLRDTSCYERALHATWWRDPAGKVFVLEKRRLRERLREVPRELAYRYEGVLCQIFRRAGEPEQRLEQRLDDAWQQVLGEVRSLSDPRHIPSLLWRASSSPAAARVAPLKPKLMLRVFVDEIPDSDERGILRGLAYGGPCSSPLASRETLDLLARAVAALHLQLLRHADELEALSDGVLCPARISLLSPPYRQYEEWLFQS
jgi:hypothetical protein